MIEVGLYEMLTGLKFVDLSGGHDQIISGMPSFFPQDRASVSVSPDRRRILFTSVPNINAVIQMVDGFRQLSVATYFMRAAFTVTASSSPTGLARSAFVEATARDLAPGALTTVGFWSRGTPAARRRCCARYRANCRRA